MYLHQISIRLITLILIFIFTGNLKAQNNTGPLADDNSKIVSYDMPETMKPGEEYVVTITMINTGKNKWKKSDNYQLSLFDEADNMFQADVWGIKDVSLPYDVNPDEKIIFLFKITAPAENGTYNSRWVMTKDGASFGEYTVNFIKVSGEQSNSSSEVDGNNAEFVSIDIPEYMLAGEKYQIGITFKNTGIHPWYSLVSSDYKLVPVTDSSMEKYPDWNSTSYYLSNTIDTGLIFKIELDVTAPLIPGNYKLQWRMKKGEYFFGEATKKVNVNVSKGGKSMVDERKYNSAFVEQNIPDYMTEDEYSDVSITLRNTGNKTWLKESQQLVVIDRKQTLTTLNSWGVGYIQLPENVDPGKYVTFNFKVRPQTTGWQHFQMSMMTEEGYIFGEPTKAVEVIVSKK